MLRKDNPADSVAGGGGKSSADSSGRGLGGSSHGLGGSSHGGGSGGGGIIGGLLGRSGSTGRRRSWLTDIEHLIRLVDGRVADSSILLYPISSSHSLMVD